MAAQRAAAGAAGCLGAARQGYFTAVACGLTFQGAHSPADQNGKGAGGVLGYLKGAFVEPATQQQPLTPFKVFMNSIVKTPRILKSEIRKKEANKVDDQLSAVTLAALRAAREKRKRTQAPV